MNRTWALMFVIVLVGFCGLPASASRRVDSRDIDPEVRAYMRVENPDLRPGYVLVFEEYEVPRMWEALEVQAFLARFSSKDGQQFSELLLLYRNDEIHPFGSAFGGHGLMSAVVVDSSLFYSFSSGSGLHRSALGRASIVDGRLVITEPASFQGIDVFVREADGDVSVDVGDYLGFNKWKGTELMPSARALFSSLP